MITLTRLGVFASMMTANFALTGLAGRPLRTLAARGATDKPHCWPGPKYRARAPYRWVRLIGSDPR